MPAGYKQAATLSIPVGITVTVEGSAVSQIRLNIARLCMWQLATPDVMWHKLHEAYEILTTPFSQYVTKDESTVLLVRVHRLLDHNGYYATLN